MLIFMLEKKMYDAKRFWIEVYTILDLHKRDVLRQACSLVCKKIRYFGFKTYHSPNGPASPHGGPIFVGKKWA